MKSLNMTISSFGEDLNTLKPGYFAKACDFVPEFLVPTARMVMADDDTISYHVDKDKPCLSCSTYAITPRGILTKIVRSGYDHNGDVQHQHHIIQIQAWSDAGCISPECAGTHWRHDEPSKRTSRQLL